MRPLDTGGYGLDALWNDDLHHSAVVALTGHNDAYYTDYLGNPQEFISAVKYGYLYQGQWYKWQQQDRGTNAFDLPPAHFLTFIENHDQIANSAHSERIHKLTSPGRFKAMTALILLAPGTPMLFQGQEFNSSAPFYYFADHKPELAEKVAKGRHAFLSQWRTLVLPEMQTAVRSPADRQTFERSILDWTECDRNRVMWNFHRELLKLRREDPVFRMQRLHGVDGAVLGPQAFLLRFFGEESGDRLMLINFGVDLDLDRVPEPLLAAPQGMAWKVLFSTESPAYGGSGTTRPDAEGSWHILGESAVVLAPVAARPRKKKLKQKNV